MFDAILATAALYIYTYIHYYCMFDAILIGLQHYMKNGEDLGTCLRVPRIRRGALEYFVDTETLKQSKSCDE